MGRHPSFASVALAALASFVARAPTGADGHCYFMEPVSRNFWYTTVFQDRWTFEDIEFCPHCLQGRGPAATQARAEANTAPELFAEYNHGDWPLLGQTHPNGNFFEPEGISVRHGICGDPVQTSEEDTNKYGKKNAHYPVLDTYSEGAVIEMKVAMSVYHWGHLEFFICNAADLAAGEDSVVTQECFNKYPLTRAADDGDASPIDPNYPGRYYVDPPCREDETDQTKLPGAEKGPVNTARYQLPEGLVCDRCTIQMIYYTSHVCVYPGYLEFNPPSWPSECAPVKEDWFNLDPGMCGGSPQHYPEEFYNCADVSITSNGSASPAAPAPAPRPSPSPESDPAPETGAQPDWEPEPAAETTTPETPSPVDETASETPSPVTPIRPFSNGGEDDNDDACLFTGGYYEECDGCCIAGYECQEMSNSYSECRPVEGACSDDWNQCGGLEWDGPTCCWPGATCKSEDKWYSHCEPDVNPELPRPSKKDVDPQEGTDGCDNPVAPYDQCGPDGDSGSTCCREGYECEAVGDDFSECRPVEGACVGDWQQCGGAAYSGTTCCWPGAECAYKSKWHSQCEPV